MYDYPELLALIIVFCGITLQSIIGIGYALLAAPLLFIIEPNFVPGPVLLLGFCLSCLIVSQEKSHLSWRRVLPAIITRAPGSLVGAYLLVSIPLHWLQLLFGLTLLVAVSLFWKTYSLATTPINLSIAGFLSGVLGTATSVGGPPIALVYAEQNKLTARSEIAAFFLIGTPISILSLCYAGRMGLEEVMLSVKMLPGVLTGFIAAKYLDRFVPSHKLKTLLLIVSALTALLVIGKGTYNLWLN